MRDIGKNIKAARLRRGLTQDELAERLHVSRQTVSNYETGRSRPDVEMLVLAAEQLEVDVQVLLYGGPEETERRRAVCRLLAAGAALAVLGGGLLWLRGWVRRFQGRTFVLGPRYLLHCLAAPAYWFWAGWVLLGALGMVWEVRPLSRRRARTVRRAVLACLGAWAVLQTPLVAEGVCQILFVLNRKPGTGASYSGGVRVPRIWARASAWAYWIGARFPAAFALLGGALRLTRGKEETV